MQAEGEEDRSPLGTGMKRSCVWGCRFWEARESRMDGGEHTGWLKVTGPGTWH